MTSAILPHKEVAQFGPPREAIDLVWKIGGDGWTLNDTISSRVRSKREEISSGIYARRTTGSAGEMTPSFQARVAGMER